jgi:hypothetical protein
LATAINKTAINDIAACIVSCMRLCLQEKFDRIALGKFYTSYKRLNASMSAMNGGTCGVCNDCNEKFQGSSSRLQATMQRRMQVHCFEPSATNYKALTEMHRHFFGSSNKTARGNELRLHNTAMSNYTGTVDMPSNCGELCQVRDLVGRATVNHWQHSMFGPRGQCGCCNASSPTYPKDIAQCAGQPTVRHSFIFICRGSHALFYVKGTMHAHTVNIEF